MRQDETYPHVSGRIPSLPSSGSQKDLAGDLTQEVLILVAYVNLQVAELTGLVPLAFQVLRFKMPETRLISVRRGGYNQGSLDDLRSANPGDQPRLHPDQDYRTQVLSLMGCTRE